MPDKIDGLQVFVNHVVLEILCKPKRHKAFDISFFHPRFRAMVDKINDRYIYLPVKNAFEICKKLPKNKLKILEKALRNNNRIEDLCKNRIEPVTYEELSKISPELKDNLYSFCKHLYEIVLIRVPFTSRFRHIDEHYKLFSEFNRFNRCPACGLFRLLKPDEIKQGDKMKRDAYDHYFKKESYPFSSVNFYNLVPMCNNCNSKYKLRHDIIKNQHGNRIKAFYPFKNYPDFTFSIAFNEIQDLKPTDLSVTFDCNGFSDEIVNWNSVFNIKNRYESFCKGDDSYNWIEQALIFVQNDYGSYQQYKDALKSNKFANENFLKLAMLDSFEQAGIIAF